MEDGDPSPRFSLSADRRGRLAGRAGPVLRVAARSRDRGSGSAAGPTRWSRGLAQQGRGRRMSRMLRRSWARRSVPFSTCRASPRSQGSKPSHQTQRHNVVRMTTSQRGTVMSDTRPASFQASEPISGAFPSSSTTSYAGGNGPMVSRVRRCARSKRRRSRCGLRAVRLGARTSPRFANI